MIGLQLIAKSVAIWVCAQTFVAVRVFGQSPDAALERLEEQAFKQAAALVGPSVVQIQTVGGLDRVGSLLTGTGPTTGVVVSADGYVISSAFNFVSKPASVLVTLPDGRRFPARVVANDRSRMLTLLKIEAADLVFARAAPKSSFRVGQWAIALGRTFEGPTPNVSVGIVSALNRVWGKAVQTDANVSPMNYGGPLVDIQGRVLGILVPLSPDQGSDVAGVEWYDSGIGFAIPLDDIERSLERLKSGEDLSPGLLGIAFKGRDLYAAEPIIDRVRYNSPAQQAGLKSGDLILEVDGQKVVRVAQVKQALGNKLAGDAVAFRIQRGDDEIEARATLVEQLEPYESAFLGILPAREPRGTEAAAGVSLRFVYPDSPAAHAGLKPKDRIVRFNDAGVANAPELMDLVSRLRPGDNATLVFLHDEKESTAEVTLTSVPNAVPADLRPAVIPSPEKPQPDPEKPKPNPDNAKNEAQPASAEPDGSPRTGRFTDKLPAGEHEFWAYVPEEYNPAYTYSLMVWLHPHGDTMEAAAFKMWKPICDQRGIILLAPKAEKIAGWNPNEAEAVKAAVDYFRSAYAVDPTRVFVHSYSTGGSFAALAAFKHRDLFRGLALAAAPIRIAPPENEPDFRFQFHFVCGDRDNLHPLVERTVKGLRDLKYPASLTTVPGHEHKYPAGEHIDEIARWADMLDRI
jgi:serine protease Do